MVDFFRWTFLSESHLSIILNITYRIKVSARHSESTYSEVTSLILYVKICKAFQHTIPADFTST